MCRSGTPIPRSDFLTVQKAPCNGPVPAGRLASSARAHTMEKPDQSQRVIGNPDLVAPVPCHLFTALVEEDQTLWLRN